MLVSIFFEFEIHQLILNLHLDYGILSCAMLLSWLSESSLSFQVGFFSIGVVNFATNLI